MGYVNSVCCFVLGSSLGLLGGVRLAPIKDANAPKLLPIIEKREDEIGAGKFIVGMDNLPSDGKISVREVVDAILVAREYKPLTDNELNALEALGQKAEKILPTQTQSLFTALQELKK